MIGLLLLSAPAGAAADCPRPVSDADQEAVGEAKKAFGEGIYLFNDGRCPEAMAFFANAVELWPALDEAPQVVIPGGLGRQRYTPFLFLGLCSRPAKGGGSPEAAGACFDPLRYSMLAQCRGFVQADGSLSSDLEDLVRACGVAIGHLGSVEADAYFREGVVAYQRKRWQAAADAMWRALAIRDEDGTKVAVGKLGEGGRWGRRYLPRFFLGAALLEIECLPEAEDQLARTLVADATFRSAPAERAELGNLRLRLEARPGEESSSLACWEWCCWLEEEP